MKNYLFFSWLICLSPLVDYLLGQVLVKERQRKAVLKGAKPRGSVHPSVCVCGWVGGWVGVCVFVWVCVCDWLVCATLV